MKRESTISRRLMQRRAELENRKRAHGGASACRDTTCEGCGGGD